MFPSSNANDVECKDIASTSIEMAKYVEKVRPDVLIFPLRGGYVISKFVLEALRSNLKIPASDYDPPVVYTTLNSFNRKAGKEHLSKLRKRFPEYKKIMIIDYSHLGFSPKNYLAYSRQELNEFEEKVFVNLMSNSNNEETEEQIENLQKFLKDDKFEFNFSRLKHIDRLPFDDEEDLMGMDMILERTKKRGTTTLNYEPFGFSYDLEKSSLAERLIKSREFFQKVKRALNN